ncbi:MAG: ABC transporter substrate-binding protein [Thermodesulfobacteriota bacterium]|nr:ABC transporter substrate-binding protein [Thermodesulfobacteriota bacterium]
MTVRRILLIAPLLLILILLQSYLWVPSYDEQTKGNPDRLRQYIAASIGDASQLNPILSADTASSQIESLVFEGLLDRDENLRFRGRLATSWEVSEEASFHVNESAMIPGIGRLDAEDLVELIRQAQRGEGISAPGLGRSLENIRKISLMPPETFEITRTQEEAKIRMRVHRPARIHLSLAQVDPALFDSLSHLLGRDYFSSFEGTRYLSFDTAVGQQKAAHYAKEILPATEHNPILVFRLRPGVRFHDGHIVDAYDVKFTFEAIMNPKNLSPRVSDYEPVKRVDVVDPLTLRVVYKRLYSPAIGTWTMGILPEHLLNRKALEKEAERLGKDVATFSMRQSGFNRAPVGCGPFKFSEWKSDQYIALDRFDDYWEGPPNYSRYVFRIIPDLLTQEMEFYAGTVDHYGVQPHQVKRLRVDPRFQSFSGTSFGYTYIGYNMRRWPFNDPKVRRALGMAIDVDKITNYVLYGQGERITGPFVKQTDYYNHRIDPIPYDPQGALRLLAEAGFVKDKYGWLQNRGKRLQFTLITNSGNDLRKSILSVCQDAWRQIGIDVRTDLLEWSVFIQERVDKSDFDALILGWVMGIEPDLYQIWHSSQTNPNQLNFVGFQDDEADDLIVKIRREYDRRKQVLYSHRLHEIIAREQPYTFLYVGKWTAILDRRIVIQERDEKGQIVHRKITPTKTGNYTFHFNKWLKMPEAPSFALDG